jgi:molecular chaperone DnaK
MAKVIGIDLGTTSSRVAIMQSGRPVIIENSEGEGTTPSYVAFRSDGARLVGEAALRYSLEKPENVIFAVKRLIGRRYSDPIVQQLKRFMPFDIIESAKGDAWVRVGNTDYSPDQIEAFTLQKMKSTADDYLASE